MKTISVLILSAICASGAAIPVKSFTHWSNLLRGDFPATDGGSGRIEQMTSNYVGRIAYWTLDYTNDQSARFKVIAPRAHYTLPVPVSIGGTNYTFSTGTNWIESITGASTATENLIATLPSPDFTTNYNFLWMGWMAFNMTNNQSAGQINIDTVYLQGSWGVLETYWYANDTGFFAAHGQTNGTITTNGFGVIITNGLSTIGNDFKPLAIGKTYLALILYESHNAGWVRIKLLDPDNGYQVAEESDSGLWNDSSKINYIRFYAGYIRVNDGPSGSYFLGPFIHTDGVSNADMQALITQIQGEAVPHTIARGKFVMRGKANLR
jgi:hypothetical protein